MAIAYFSALLYIVCLTAGIYFFGYASRKSSAFYVTTLEVIIGNLFIAPVVLFKDHLSFSELFTKPTLQNWLWLAAASLTGFIGGNFFSVLNLKFAGERSNSLLSPAITACAVLTSAIVFKDLLSFIKIAGIIITLCSVVTFLLHSTKRKYKNRNSSVGLWTGMATIVCITATIIFSILGTMNSDISYFHSIWIRLFAALPIVLPSFILHLKTPINKSVKFYCFIACGVIAQTIIASSLWFYCTYTIGISTFQVIIATLPFFVYAIDVFLFKRTKPSLYFLVTALFALLGILLVTR